MKSKAMIFALAALTAVPALAQEPPMETFNYPETKRLDVSEELFGRTFVDPYRWLEADLRSDDDVARWVTTQNALTRNYLDTLPTRDVFRDRLASVLDYEQATAPIKRANRYFFTRNATTTNQPALLVRDGATGEDQVLIDPNTWSEDNADALAEWSVSDNGKYIAYGVQSGGSDWRTIQVLDVDTQQVRQDEVKWARFTQIAWDKAGKGFFYSSFPEPKGDAGASAAVSGHAIYYHALGTEQADDRLVYSTPDDPKLLHLSDRSDDGRYLFIASTASVGVNALTVIDLSTEDWAPRTVVEGFDAEWSVVGNSDDRLFILTSDNAERRKLVTLDLDDAEGKVVEIVPEDDAVLTRAVLVGGRLIAYYLVDANTEVRRFNLNGTPEGKVDLPGIGSAAVMQGDAADTEAFFLFSSYNMPISVLRYDVDKNAVSTWFEPKVPVDLDRVKVEQRFYHSHDGTRVPIFIVRRDDVDAAAPTLLYGYGGYAVSQVPVYNPAQMAWVEQGGVLAVANIRGGGEYGRAWHMAGRLVNKQNVFDDFIAAAEFLKAEGITSEKGLAIQGESNGGLLVGAVVNQRPDLFDAALPGVGVMDMLRFHKFTGGAMWISDFGNPDIEADFDNLLAYSPYHNINPRPGVDYPAILATTAEADDRVVPGHTFKYVARLQAEELGPKPRLVRVEARAGHGAGMPLDKSVSLYADMWAFAARWTGLKVAPVK
jgi:prolyl oligopeptidase